MTVCVSLQVNDVLRRAEVWETNNVCSDGGRGPWPPLVSQTSDPIFRSWPLLCNYFLHCVSFLSSHFYNLNILVALFPIYNSNDTKKCQKSFTEASKLSSVFLFPYSCYHIRYSFVPCKYVVVIIHPSSSFIRPFPSKIAIVVVKCDHSIGNSYAYFFFFLSMPSYEKWLYWGRRKRKHSFRTKRPGPSSYEQMHQAHVINFKQKVGVAVQHPSCSCLPHLWPFQRRTKQLGLIWV